MPERAPPSENADDSTGLSLLSTWPRVYWFVLVVFVLIVVALCWLTRAFS
ncbi:MAG TPA: hypothetical protein VM008_05945 [Phycisphaerae bacterium]|nr:hypothetical protein [Phycisphaerae bacterium]